MLKKLLAGPVGLHGAPRGRGALLRVLCADCDRSDYQRVSVCKYGGVPSGKHGQWVLSMDARLFRRDPGRGVELYSAAGDSYCAFDNVMNTAWYDPGIGNGRKLLSTRA